MVRVGEWLTHDYSAVIHWNMNMVGCADGEGVLMVKVW